MKGDCVDIIVSSSRRRHAGSAERHVLVVGDYESVMTMTTTRAKGGLCVTTEEEEARMFLCKTNNAGKVCLLKSK
jgi:hypothetical protein